MIRADLHVHTYYSDGGLSPSEAVALAKRAGVGLLSVTDHDTSLASEEVEAIAAREGIKTVRGTEISAYEGNVKVHILCYGIGADCGRFQAFQKSLCEGAEERCMDILKKLSQRSVNIGYEEVLRERRCSLSPVHAMHVATAGAKKGYSQTPHQFYSTYLEYGRIGFSAVARPKPEEVVKLISDCGGVSSIAHPGRISLEREGVVSLIRRLAPLGLSGIEAVYSSHTAKETQYYRGLAEEYSLLVTGGSDTHYRGGGRQVGSPAFYPDERLLSALKII